MIKEILSQPGTVAEVLEIWRGGPGEMETGSDEVWLHLFRAPTAQEDQALLWDMFQIIIHEEGHRREAAEYRQFARQQGRLGENALREGADSVWTETVWSEVEPHAGERELRQEFLGEYADLEQIPPPSITEHRYRSYAVATKLIRAVGILNLYAAYFLGDVPETHRHSRTG